MGDLRYSLRLLARSPVTALVALVSLSLGIGANTAIFSLLNALILRDLPVHKPDQLVRVFATTPLNPDREQGLSLATYLQLRKDQRVFSDVFASMDGGLVNLEANGQKYAGSMSAVTGEYFSTLGVEALLGRTITRDDLALESGAPSAVAVLGYACWQHRYHGDREIVGKTIYVEDRPLSIVGVTPASFSGVLIDAAPDVIVPIGYSGTTAYRDRRNSHLSVFARMKTGVTMEQAQAQIRTIWPAIRLATAPPEYSGSQRDAFLSRRISVTPAATGDSYLRELYTRPLYVLMAMVGLLLLVACVNLANVMLARAEARRRELGIRIALGAARSRIVRQMITESLLLSAAGALVGFILAYWACRKFVETLWMGYVSPALDTSPDLHVLAFTTVIVIITALLSGLWPAWSALRSDPAVAIQRNTRAVHGGANRLGRMLISAQIGISLVLVVGAVLFIRSLEKLRAVDVGFRRDGVLSMNLFPQATPDGRRMPNRIAYYQELAERLQRIPGVEAVSYSHMGPVLHYEYKEPTVVPASEAPPVQAVFEAVGPGFFHLIGMRLLAGREFTWRDDDRTPRVAIISESLARQVFPSGDPIGKIIDFGDRRGLRIVGVVSSASLWKPQSREPMAVYHALTQMPSYNSPHLVVRVRGAPAPLIPSARRVIESLGRHIILRAETLDQRAESFLGTDRMIALLSTFFGMVAVFLAAVGLYGLMSYAVGRRTAEIGLRMALGAQPSGVLALIMKESIGLLLAGMLVGVPAALAGARLASGMVFGVVATDPLTIGLAAGILLTVAVLAGYIPARRAAQIDPMSALRSE